ncbi:hypothetical protein ACOBV8_19055 (plasmid) [Pseudoalteromonas espejiana]
MTSLTWGRQVKLPDNFDSQYVLKRGTKTRKQWLEYWNIQSVRLQIGKRLVYEKLMDLIYSNR